MFGFTEHIVSSCFFGFIITIFLLVLLFMVLNGLFPNFFKPVSALVFVVLAGLLFAQSVMLMGAYYTYRELDSSFIMTFEVDQPQESDLLGTLYSEFKEQYPALSVLDAYLPDQQKVSAISSQTLAEINKQLSRSIKMFMLRRVLWMLGFLSFFGFLLGYFASKSVHTAASTMRRRYNELDF